MFHSRSEYVRDKQEPKNNILDYYVLLLKCLKL